ncbi:MAG: hypothetical protein V4717_11745 [Bacteroidota bacterium]
MQTKHHKWLEVFVVIILIGLSFAIFYNTIHLGFFSDDFFVLHRLTVKKQFWTTGFFRPVADLALIINYKLGGLNASSYRVVSILLHAINGYLLFRIILNLKLFNYQLSFRFAFLSAFFFIIYPFHSESIIWVVGRGSVLACFFSLLSLYIYTTHINIKLKHLIACGFFFISLASYESVIVLPGILFIACFYKNRSFLQSAKFSSPLFATLLLHVLVRKLVAGIIVGNYGIDMFNENLFGYVERYVKSIGRLVIPGMYDSVQFATWLLLFTCLVFASFIIVYRKYQTHISAYTTIWMMLIISQLVPGIFGVDTHNQDGERLLYLPSFILCTAFAFFLILYIHNQYLLFFGVLSLATFCLQKQLTINENWMYADKGIKNIIHTIQKTSLEKTTIYLANIPELYEGSFMFRNGLPEALELVGVETNYIEIINYLSKDELHHHPERIMPVATENGTTIFPNLFITGTGIHLRSNSPGNTSKRILLKKNSHFFYWNKEKLVKLF